MTPGQGEDEIAAAIERFTPKTGSAEVVRFAREVTRAARPTSVGRAKAFLHASCRLGSFGEAHGLELDPSVLLRSSVIERMCHPGSTATMSEATRRTLRSNLRAVAASVLPATALAPRLSRERAKSPYSAAEVASYLALADAQPTKARRLHAGALLCLSAGAGLVGTDLKAVSGDDVAQRSGGVVVEVRGRHPRVVPVLSRYHPRLLEAAQAAGDGLIIGGDSPDRRNVTSALVSALRAGSDLPRVDVSRLRATWLCEAAAAVGLQAFMDAAGVVCSQRLGDLIAHLERTDEARAVVLLGGSC